MKKLENPNQRTLEQEDCMTTRDHRLVPGGLSRRALGFGTASLLVLASFGAQAADPYLDQIKKRGVLRVAGVTYNPSIYKRPNGEWLGIDVDILSGFAAKLGVKIEFIDTQWSTIVAGLQTDRWDVTPATGVTPQRAAVIDFSIPNMRGGGTAVFLRDNPKIKAVADLNNPKVLFAQNAGTWQENFVKQHFPTAELKLFPQGTQDQAVLEVVSQRADATIVDAPVSPIRFDNLHAGKLGFLPARDQILAGHVQDGAFGVPKGADSVRIAIDDYMRALIASGEMAKIYDKHVPGLRPPTP